MDGEPPGVPVTCTTGRPHTAARNSGWLASAALLEVPTLGYLWQGAALPEVPTLEHLWQAAAPLEVPISEHLRQAAALPEVLTLGHLWQAAGLWAGGVSLHSCRRERGEGHSQSL